MPRRSYRIFDADVHHQVATHDALAKYLPPRPVAPTTAGGAAVPHVDGAFRIDSIPPGGGMPGSDPEFVVEHHLERFGIDYALLSCGSYLGLSGMHDLDRAVELQRAINEWTVEEWFPVDERFVGSISVATSVPKEAAEEIRRMASNPRMVQVVATGLTCAMGNPFLHPIYEACEEVGLPFTLHQGGLPAGQVVTPTSFVEYHIDMCFPALPNLVSLITEGVFEKFPRLTVVFNEFGIAWLPFVMWRLDMEYRAGHDELPWLRRLPSEYIAEHVRFTTQPLEEPNNPRDLATLLSLFPADRMLMFSSDYPHWDTDSPEYALRNLPEEWRERIFFENARETFRLDQRLGKGAPTAGVTA